ncbi:MAG: hypothetical protein JW982_09470 [Spirochaetes bacterium]|nr:hypothetical protein [Spirochaetota bacterium]
MGNDISALVKMYDKFITDIQKLIQDVSNILTEQYKVEIKGDWWAPRSRSAWDNKQSYVRMFLNENIAFYVCIDLQSDIPYLLLHKTDINIKNSSSDTFSEYDGFSHIQDTNIPKEAFSKNINIFQRNWGTCYYCKVDIQSITSSEIVKSDLRTLIGCLMEKKKDDDVKYQSIIFINE